MCGIIGAVAQRDVALILLEGLKRLEYRGYDSAGIALITPQQTFERYRALGKVRELEPLLTTKLIPGTIGIAHTRWATHGKPSQDNAHPHIASDEIALVHNGIIENHEALRAHLIQAGCKFTSETDSELVAHLVYCEIQQGHSFRQAVQIAAGKLEGAFAIAFMNRNDPSKLIALRRGSPLVIGLGIGENFIASDQLALLPVAQKFIYLEEGDLAEIYRDKVNIYDLHGEKVERKTHAPIFRQDRLEKSGYRHFMLKEIFEQPDALLSTIEGRLNGHRVLIESFGPKAPELFSHIKRLQIVACGTSFHAGLIGKYWLENLAQLPTQIEIASEYRYRQPIIEPDTLLLTLSQSGETADTLGALHKAKALDYATTLAICNVPESSLVRESELVFMTHAGPEIGVASTKAFTTQLAALFLLTIALGKSRKIISADLEANLIAQLEKLPNVLRQTLELDPSISQLAKHFADKQHALFIGRGLQYPTALEGALKLKEISYIHAEAYPAGELKHGPLALVDPEMPVIALAPAGELIEKLKSNVEEVRARGGDLIIFTDPTTGLANGSGNQVITLPVVESLFAPIVYTLPLQLLAYHVAILKGTDVDQPRNLAKSVTVE